MAEVIEVLRKSFPPLRLILGSLMKRGTSSWITVYI